MAKLPDISSLGSRPTPSGSYRAARYEDSSAGTGLMAIGKSLGKASDVLTGISDISEKKLKDKAIRQSSYAYLNLSKDILDFVNEKENDPAYEKHIPDYQDFITKRTDEYSKTIEDDTVREDFQLKAAQAALGGYGSLVKDSSSKKKDADIYGTSLAADKAKEVFLNAPDEKMRDESIKAFSESVDRLDYTSMDRYDKFATKKKWVAETREAWVEKLPAAERIKVLEGVAENRKVVLNPNIPKDFSSSAKLVIDFEKEDYVENDGNDGPSKFGIVGSQNGLTPEQVKNLTPEKATEIAKKNYWDKVGADDLPENIRFIAFDTAYNFGVETAKRMIKRSGNDPAALLELRRNMHNDIADEKQDSHGQYKTGWKKRDLFIENQVFKDVITAKDKDTFGIPTDRLDKLLEKAKSEVEAEGVKSRAGLRLREEDAISMSMAGKENPNPVTFAEFQRAYPEDAEKRYEAHNQTIAFGVDYNRALTMPLSQQDELLAKYTPKEGEGFDAAQKKQESMSKAIDAANKARKSDPIAFAMQSGFIPKEQIDFSMPENTAKQLDSRVSISKEMSGKYGTPVAVFTKQEASQFAGLMESKDALSKLALLKSLKAGIKDGDAYSTAIQQIRKDSPVTALAGTYMAMGDKVVEVANPSFSSKVKESAGEVALNILRGEELINPSKKTKEEGGTSAKGFPMPPEKDLLETFSNETKGLFAGIPEMHDQLFQATKAHYAAVASDKSVYTGVRNIDILKQSIKAVLGEKTEINGGDVLVTWGMDVYEFETKAKSDFEVKRKDGGLSEKAIKWDDVTLRMTPVFGLFRAYNGERPVLDRSGEPLIINTIGKQ